MVDQIKKTELAGIEQDDDLPPRPTKLGDVAIKEVFGGFCGGDRDNDEGAPDLPVAE